MPERAAIAPPSNQQPRNRPQPVAANRSFPLLRLRLLRFQYLLQSLLQLLFQLLPRRLLRSLFPIRRRSRSPPLWLPRLRQRFPPALLRLSLPAQRWPFYRLPDSPRKTPKPADPPLARHPGQQAYSQTHPRVHFPARLQPFRRAERTASFSPRASRAFPSARSANYSQAARRASQAPFKLVLPPVLLLPVVLQPALLQPPLRLLALPCPFFRRTISRLPGRPRS